MAENTGVCACGCGQKTRLAPRTCKARGWKKGEPLKYVRGHSRRGTAWEAVPNNPDNPHVCACGCGQPTALITKSNRTRGEVKGEYRKYIRGHADTSQSQNRFGTQNSLLKVISDLREKLAEARKELAAMTLRAEKAEAELRRLSAPRSFHVWRDTEHSLGKRRDDKLTQQGRGEEAS